MYLTDLLELKESYLAIPIGLEKYTPVPDLHTSLQLDEGLHKVISNFTDDDKQKATRILFNTLQPHFLKFCRFIQELQALTEACLTEALKISSDLYPTVKISEERLKQTFDLLRQSNNIVDWLCRLENPDQFNFVAVPQDYVMGLYNYTGNGSPKISIILGGILNFSHQGLEESEDKKEEPVLVFPQGSEGFEDLEAFIFVTLFLRLCPYISWEQIPFLTDWLVNPWVYNQASQITMKLSRDRVTNDKPLETSFSGGFVGKAFLARISALDIQKPSHFRGGLSSIEDVVKRGAQAYDVWKYDATKFVVRIRKDSKAMEEYHKWKRELDRILEELNRAEQQVVPLLEAVRKDDAIPFNTEFPLQIMRAVQDYLILMQRQLSKSITERYDEPVPRIVLDYLAEYLLIFGEPDPILQDYRRILNRKNPDGTETVSPEYRRLERILDNPTLQLKFQTNLQRSKADILRTLRHCLWELRLSILTNFLIQIKRNAKDANDITTFYEFNQSSAIDQSLMDLVTRMSDSQVSDKEIDDILNYLEFFYKNNLKLSAHLSLPSTINVFQELKKTRETRRYRLSIPFYESFKDFVKIYGSETEVKIATINLPHPSGRSSTITGADKFMMMYEDLFDASVDKDRLITSHETVITLKRKMGELFLLFLGEEESDQQEWKTLLEILKKGDLERLSNKDLWLLNEAISELVLIRREYRYKQELKRLYQLYANSIKKTGNPETPSTSEDVVRYRMALLDTLAKAKSWVIESVEDRLLYRTAISVAEKTRLMVTPRQLCQALKKIFNIELDWVLTDMELRDLLEGNSMAEPSSLERRSISSEPVIYPAPLEQIIKESLKYDLLKLVPAHKLDRPSIDVTELIEFYKRLDWMDATITYYRREIEQMAVSAKNMAQNTGYLELQLGEDSIVRYLGPIKITQNLQSTQELVEKNLTPLEIKVISAARDLDEIKRFLVPGSTNRMIYSQTWTLEEIGKEYHRYFVRADLKHGEENKEDSVYVGKEHTIGSVLRQIVDTLLTQQRIYQLAKEPVDSLLIVIPGIGFQAVPRYEIPGWKTLAIKSAGYPFGALPTEEYSQWVEVFLLKLENLNLLYRLFPEGRKVFVCDNLGTVVGLRALQSFQTQAIHLSNASQKRFLANGFIGTDYLEADASLLKDIAPEVDILVQPGVGLPLWKVFQNLINDPLQTKEKGFVEIKVIKDEPAEKRVQALTSKGSVITLHQLPEARHSWKVIQRRTHQENTILDWVCRTAKKEDLLFITPDEHIVREADTFGDLPEQTSLRDEYKEIKQESLKRAIAAIPIRLEEHQHDILFHEICVYSKNSEYKMELKAWLSNLATSGKAFEKNRCKDNILSLFDWFCQQEYKETLHRQLETLLHPGSTRETRKACLEKILEILSYHNTSRYFTLDDFLVFLNILQKTQPAPAEEKIPGKPKSQDLELYSSLFTKTTLIQDKITDPKSREILEETFSLITPYSTLFMCDPDLGDSKDFSYVVSVLITGIVFAMSKYNLRDMTIFSALKPELMAFKKYKDPQLNHLLEVYKLILEHHKILRRVAQLDNTLTIDDLTLAGIDPEILDLLEMENKELDNKITELKTKARALIAMDFSENAEELEQIIEQAANWNLTKPPSDSKVRDQTEKSSISSGRISSIGISTEGKGVQISGSSVQAGPSSNKEKQPGWKIASETKRGENQFEGLLATIRNIASGDDDDRFENLKKTVQNIFDLKLKELEAKTVKSEGMREIGGTLQRKSENLSASVEELREEQDKLNVIINRMPNCPLMIKTWFRGNTYSKFSQLLDFFGRAIAKANVMTKSSLPEWTLEYQALLGQAESIEASREKNNLISGMFLIQAKLKILESKFLEAEQVKALMRVMAFVNVKLEIEQLAVLKGRALALSRTLVPQLSGVRSFYYQLRDYYYEHPEEVDSVSSDTLVDGQTNAFAYQLALRDKKW
jgi:hypothetical protein